MLVQAVETCFKDMIGQVCQKHQAAVEELEVMPDPVHVLGERRSAAWHSLASEAHQGEVVSFAATGIPGALTETAEFVDELLLCGYYLRRPLSLIKQSIEKQKHG